MQTLYQKVLREVMSMASLIPDLLHLMLFCLVLCMVEFLIIRLSRSLENQPLERRILHLASYTNSCLIILTVWYFILILNKL